MSYAKVSCLINAGYVLLQDHLLLDNDDVEKFQSGHASSN